MFSLKGKNALVTGGSRGIGSGIAKALAMQGANVAVNCSSSMDKCEWISGEIKGLGRDSIAVKADVSNEGEVKKMFKKIKDKWGKLDILVNNAGIAHFKTFEDMTESEWDQTLDVNLKGQFLCAKEAVKIMKSSGGKIINMSSVASGGAGIGAAKLAHYVASKGGVAALTEALSVELAPYKINVNAVAPGFIDTDMTAELITEESVKKAFLNQIPWGRFGEPEDIGAAAVFLASNEADYITGIVLYVDGGWLAA